MSKNVFRVVVSVIAVVCVGVISFQNRQEDTKLSDLAMANIEALAAGEIPVKCGKDEVVGYFMTEYNETQIEYGKPCGESGYKCMHCSCEEDKKDGWYETGYEDEECCCPEMYSVVVYGQECHPNTRDNSCCNKKEEGITHRVVL